MRYVAGVALFILTVIPLSESQSATPTFMKAVAFALTAQDDAKVIVEDEPNCVFRIEGARSAGDNKTPSIEVFHLNNIDTARFRIDKNVQTNKDGSTTVNYYIVQLFGENTVYEDRAVYTWATLNNTQGPTASAHTAIVLYTTEYARLDRAWKYVFTHGCVGSKSSF